MNEITTLHQLARLPLNERRDWYIPESLSTSYLIKDTGESLVELESLIRKRGVELVLEPVSPDDNPDLYLRSTVANKLVDAAEHLLEESSGVVTIKVTDAFRPLDLQRRYFSEISEQIAREESLQGGELWNRVTQFIADPELCPPHSTGGAVDCTLVTLSDGAELVMGTSIDAISNLSQTWSDAISLEAKENRKKLFLAMESSGFVNLPTEWWHYSFGDQYWAIHHQRPAALYGSLESVPIED